MFKFPVEFLAPLPVGNKSKKYIEGFLKAGPSIAVNRDNLGSFRIVQNDRKTKSKTSSVLSTPSIINSNAPVNTSSEQHSRKSALSSAVSKKSDSFNDDTLNEDSAVFVGKLEDGLHILSCNYIH